MRINKNNGVLGLIVARKDSKGLENKNLLKFNKKNIIILIYKMFRGMHYLERSDHLKNLKRKKK